MKFIIATHNKKKLAEMQRILAPLGIEAVTDEMIGISLTEAEETGTTFAENAFIKAKSACLESGMPAIADDSGLVVDALDGAPGVYSARYSGEHGNDKSNNDLLLANLKDIADEKRTARFVSSICVVFVDGKKIVVDGACEGKIGYGEKGEGGFGYDPLFMVGDKSFAEFSAEEKDAVSHRGKAMRKLVIELEKAMATF
ncbi:MAG: RdgB/HAM1 family non-canonical purine NTP pyrophosphatase [Clostridia bacterium]